MKKKYFIITFIFLLIIAVFILLNIFKSSNSLIDIEKSIVKIIPKDNLISYEKNPFGINSKGEDGIGIGFFINKNNEIITSNHILSNKDKQYYIITNDNKKYLAQIIFSNEENDIAKIKINSKIKYHFLQITKNDYHINNEIISYGINIKNNTIIFIKGKIIGKNINLKNIGNLIEFVPEINNGFSGGPIFNSKFEVIGINYAIYDGKSYGINLLNFSSIF